jgi:hypothetical protein
MLVITQAGAAERGTEVAPSNDVTVFWEAS